MIRRRLGAVLTGYEQRDRAVVDLGRQVRVMTRAAIDARSAAMQEDLQRKEDELSRMVAEAEADPARSANPDVRAARRWLDRPRPLPGTAS